MHIERIDEMNTNFFHLINNLATHNILLDKLMIAFSKYVPLVFMVVLASTFLIGVFKQNINFRKIAFNTFIVTIINLALAFVIGSIYYVDRPFIHNKVNLLFPHVADASFPSDHAIGTMSIALGMNKYNKLVGRVLTILSIIVGISRVYVGHHYPMDVIAAYGLAFLTNYLYNTQLSYKINTLYVKVEHVIMLKLKLV